MPSARKRYGKRSKKREDEAHDRILGDPSTPGRRMRGWHGGRLSNLRTSVCSPASRALHG